jgi:hypothetical protein
MTDEDWNPELESHDQWRRRRILEQQRYRRSRERRIDYYVSPEANRIIDSLRAPKVGRDASSILNRIVVDWARHKLQLPE